MIDGRAPTSEGLVTGESSIQDEESRHMQISSFVPKITPGVAGSCFSRAAIWGVCVRECECECVPTPVRGDASSPQSACTALHPPPPHSLGPDAEDPQSQECKAPLWPPHTLPHAPHACPKRAGLRAGAGRPVAQGFLVGPGSWPRGPGQRTAVAPWSVHGSA